MTDFVHLHNHSEYSLLDGACRLGAMVARAKELGQKAIALTDHGVMNGSVEFYKAAQKAGVKPIIGCEVYVAPRTRHDKVHKLDNNPYHLILLCENNKGYQNLIQMVSLSFTEGFYSKPRVDLELLERYHEGLICSSACLAGEVARLLLSDDYDGARAKALQYQGIFGAGNYYLEMMDHRIPEQQKVNAYLVRLSNETGIPLIATNDAHYVKKEDAKVQHVMLCIQTNSLVDDPSMEFQTDEFYLKSTDEMAALFSDTPQALANTVAIAERCNVDFEFGVTKLPRFDSPTDEDNETYFRRLCFEGLARLYPDTPVDVRERLDYELDTIAKMGYIDYFLIVQDFIAYAKSRGIPVGPGRGSGAGSLCAYCVGITGVDPMRYNLLFERFLNPERISMPDFDIDFCYERRQEVIDYVVRKYGEDHVAQIITFGTMGARAAIRDVGRVMGMTYAEVDVIAKLVPHQLGITLEKAVEINPDLKQRCEDDERVRELVDMSMRIEGMARHASTHAAGVVITDEPVAHYVPLQKNDEAVVTQYPMGNIEELGLLKMDFLGLRNLTVIAHTIEMLAARGVTLDIETIPLDDPAVYEMMSQGLTGGVFQFESAGMRRTLVNLKPTHLEDLIAVVALYRPGPMDSIDTYVKNRHNPQLVRYKTPQLAPILDVTYGCIIYQEQVMQICRELAGYSYGRADLVRRAMSKKKADIMEQERDSFLQGCQQNGIDVKIAQEIFNDMSSFASYAFNKSHAAAYALLAYQTAYLKCHYKNEYMAALLTSVLDFTPKVVEYIEECGRLGLKVLPPDINSSLDVFSVQRGHISFGLVGVKNLGRGVIRAILDERAASGPFTSFYDFCTRMYGSDLNKRGLEGLIKCGAFDNLGANRRQLLEAMPMIVDDIDASRRRNLEGQLDLFAAAAGDEPQAQDIEYPRLPEFPIGELLAIERETTGIYLSGHPVAAYNALRDELGCVRIADIFESRDMPGGSLDGQTVSVLATVSTRKHKATRSDETMAFVSLEDTSGVIESLVFPKVLTRFSEQLRVEQVVVVTGRVSMREDEDPKLICELVRAVGDVPKNGGQPLDRPRKLYLKVPARESDAFSKIETLCDIFKGATPFNIYFEDEKKLLEVPMSMYIELSDPLVREFQLILGEKNVAFK